MPVSPQDFELYSRMTGAPMPSDAMSRMQMAPDVYNFTKNFARRPNLLEKTGNLVKNIGRGAVMALGAPLVAASEAENARMQEQLRNQPKVTGDREKTPAEIIEDKRMARLERTSELKQEERDDKEAKAMKMMRAKAGEIVNSEPKPVAKTPDGQLLYDAADLNTQQSTTADNYDLPLVENQTSSNVINKKIEQGSQIADSTPNVAEVLSESQDSSPVDFADSVKVQQQMEAEMIGKSIGKRQLSKYMGTKGLDKALIGAVIQSKIKPEMFGTSASVDSDLLDHPDVKDVVGGEEPNPKMGTNTSPTQDLSDFHKEMRKMDAMERNKEVVDEVVDQYQNLSPSERQLVLGTEQIDSPNEMQGRITAAEESSNKLIDVMKSMGGEPSRAQQIEADKARSRVEQKTAYKQRMAGMKTDLTKQYYPSDVARTDIQIGGMVDRKTGLGKSVGISRTPLNGDTKIGFNIMNDPTNPTEVGTFDFIAPPETMESLESREEGDLGSLTVGKLFNVARQRKQGFRGI